MGDESEAPSASVPAVVTLPLSLLERLLRLLPLNLLLLSSLLERLLRLLPLSLFLFLSSLSVLLFSRSLLLLGSLAFPCGLLQRLLGLLPLQPFSLVLLLSSLSLLLFSRSCLLLGSLAFPLSLLQGLLGLLGFLPLSLVLLTFGVCFFLLLLLLGFVPLPTFVERVQIASCLVQHVMWVDPFDSCRVEGACGQDAGDEKERSDTHAVLPDPRFGSSILGPQGMPC